jgi:hypothetical protein
MNEIFEIIPREAELLISAFQDLSLEDPSLQEKLSDELLLEDMVKDCPGEWIASSIAPILQLKLKVDSFVSNSFKSSVSLIVQRDGPPPWSLLMVQVPDGSRFSFRYWSFQRPNPLEANDVSFHQPDDCKKRGYLRSNHRGSTIGGESSWS